MDSCEKMGFVFPGQGSQSVGMFADEALFKKASEVLEYDLLQLVKQGPEEKLNQTEFTQPAILASSVALWYTQKHETPLLMAGHSLGEYSALVCAESIAFEDAIKLVSARGKYMQDAVPTGEGAMAAVIGLGDDTMTELCAQVAAGQVLAPANFNAIGQVVVAGETQAVARLVEKAKESGAKLAKLIPVSVPSHCALMQPAAEKLMTLLKEIDIKAPKIPVIHNVDVKVHFHPDDIRECLVQQLYRPVRWVETIQYFAAEGITEMTECGPGKVLAGLNKRITKTIPTKGIA